MRANNLRELERQLAPQLLDAIGADDSLRQLVANTVSKHVQSDVYTPYEPAEYKRRGIDGGLADPDNVERTGISASNSSIYLRYENITEGVDSLKGKEITDTIEEGIRENWMNPDGVWSLPRPFIEPATEELKNSNKLRNQLVTVLRSAGLDVK